MTLEKKLEQIEGLTSERKALQSRLMAVDEELRVLLGMDGDGKEPAGGG